MTPEEIDRTLGAFEEMTRSAIDEHVEGSAQSGMDPVLFGLGIRRALARLDFYVVKHIMGAAAKQAGMDPALVVGALEEIGASLKDPEGIVPLEAGTAACDRCGAILPVMDLREQKTFLFCRNRATCDVRKWVRRKSVHKVNS